MFSLTPQNGLLATLIPLYVAAYATKVIVDLLKLVPAFADSQSGVKQIAGLVVSALLALGAGRLHLGLSSTSLDAITASDVSTVLTAVIVWALAMLIHNGARRTAPAPARQ